MSKVLLIPDEKEEIVLYEKLSEDFGRLYLSDNYSDVDFLVENDVIPGHKVVLAARSEYFRALLYGGLSETNKKQISLKVPLDAFKIILKYIYTGKINLCLLQTNVVLDILGLSNLFGYLELKDEISNFLMNSLQLQNVSLIFDSSRLYELSNLTQMCFEFMDKHAVELLEQDNFRFLYKDSLILLLSRDSFFAPEINIFQAIKRWIDFNSDLKPEEIAQIVSKIRLPLISLEDLLSEVRPTSIINPDTLLDAIQVKTQSRLNRLYRGRVVLNENVATTKHGARIIQGVCDGPSILDSCDHQYDLEKGYARHAISSPSDGNGIIIEFAEIYIVNHIKLHLWDLDVRSYSYIVEVSVEKNFWEKVVDHSTYHCRSWQHLHFEQRAIKYIRITGTHNTVNRVFHLVAVKAMLTKEVPELVNGLVSPTNNICCVEKSAVVVEGVSRNKNSLLNGNVTSYDWDCGYTCHQLGSGYILIQLGQPYHIGSFRLLLWDCDDRYYGFYIETSVDQTEWETVVDKKQDRLQSWQTFKFEPRAISYIRITGTYNSANEIFHIVHFECPSQEEKV